jgi:preprotein translocase subunit SecB
MTNGNGAPLENAAPPQLNVLAQYIKDLSFENPNAPASLGRTSSSPRSTSRSTSRRRQSADHELRGDAQHRMQGRERDFHVLFGIELVYAGVFRIQNVPQESLHPVVMIECPRLLFPFARRSSPIVGARRWLPAAAARSGRFRRLYRQNMAHSRGSRASRAESYQLSESTELLQICYERSKHRIGGRYRYSFQIA